jgi:hypothetical protein
LSAPPATRAIARRTLQDCAAVRPNYRRGLAAEAERQAKEKTRPATDCIYIIAHPAASWDTIYFPAKSGSSNRRQKAKVFWFFSSEKNKTLLFLKKKKQKDFCFPALR